MADRNVSPPPEKMVRQQTVPDHGTVFYSELVSRESARYQAIAPIKRGTAYATTVGADQRVIDGNPTLYFVREIAPYGSNTVNTMPSAEWIILQWSSDPDSESSYNADITYLGDAVANPAYARVYTIRRDVYDAAPTIALGTPLTALIAIKVTAAGSGYTSAPAVVIGGSGGATAEAVLNAAGGVSHVTLTSEGSGYSAGALPAISFTGGGGSGATAVAVMQPAAAILTSQKKEELPESDPLANQYVRVLRVYEVLPGPLLPFTRWDDDLGPIQGTRRAVVWADQAATLTATGKTTYEAREGSSFVAWEIVETWSNGTDDDDNPAYPILVTDFYDPERGAVQSTSQLIVKTGNEVGSKTESGGVVTQIRYEPFNEFLLRKIIETWATVGPTLTDKDTNQLKQVVTTTKQNKATSSAVPSATQDVRVQDLGGGQVREEVAVAPEVFAAGEFEKEVPDVVPPKFRVAVPIVSTEETSAGTAAEPTLAAGELQRREQQVNKFWKRVLVRTRDVLSLPVSLVGKETNRDGQIVTVTETLKAEGGDAVPTALKEVEVQNLGDGTVLQTEKTKPNVFAASVFDKEIPDVVPPRFRVAVPIESTETTSAGTAAEPTLGAGELQRREQQVDSFLKRVLVRTRDLVSLPVSLVGKETSREGQVITVTETLKAEGGDATPTALKDVEVQNLGDGTVLQTERDKPEVLELPETGNVQDSATPRKFLTITGETVEESTAEGSQTADAVGTNGLGVIESTVQWLTAFVTRKRTRTRVGTVDTSLTEYALNADGQLVTIATSLGASSAPSVSATTEIAQVEGVGDGKFVSRVGTVSGVLDKAEYRAEKDDVLPPRFRASMPAVTASNISAGTAVAPSLSGDEIAETQRQIDAHKKQVSVTTRATSSPPTLQGQEYDERLDLVLPYTETIGTAGAAIGDDRKVVEPLGGGKELVRSYDLTAIEAALNAYMLSYPTRVDVQLPDVLEEVTVVWSKSAGIGAASESGTAAAAGENTSININATASAQSSASVMPELIINITRPWGQNRLATDYYFFLPAPVSEADVLARLPSVSEWPDFNPKSHTLVLKGMKVALGVNCSARYSSSASEAGVSTATSSGSGKDIDLGVSLRAVTIPPTIHDALSLDTTEEEQEVTAIAEESLGALSQYKEESATASGGVVPTSLTATPGVTAIPTGDFLESVSAEPFKYGYVAVRARVVTL